MAVFQENVMSSIDLVLNDALNQTNSLKRNATLLNFSNNSLEIKLPFADLFLTRIEVFLLTSLFVLTIIGNISVIFILLFYRNRTNSSSKCFSGNNSISRMSFYIIHLSIADLSVALMSILPQIVWRYFVIFNHSQVLCKLVTFCQVGSYLNA